MTKSYDIEQLRSRSKIVYSNGKLLDYKLYGDTHRKKYWQHYEKSSYSEVQNFLYKRAMFGLSIFKQQEIKEMHPEKRYRIIKAHKRTKKELNVCKQYIIKNITDEVLKLFPNSPLAQELINGSTIDPTFKPEFSFKELGIEKDAVVDRLHKVGILPNNFYDLNK